MLPGQPQHVIQRGNNREAVFFADDDYHLYLERLRAACQKHDCEIHAYVLMTNHVHLLITPNTQDGISKTMQMVGRYYVPYINTTYQRTGTLWEGRYRATLIDSEQYLLACCRYIELNPVRAGIAKHPSAYPWSSYRYNALGKDDALITPHIVYRRLGKDDAARRVAYRQLFKCALSQETLSAIRDATNKAWLLGDERFQRKIQKQLDRRVTQKPRGGDRKSRKYRGQARNRRINRV